MSDGHCFISYSHADGLDFVTKLADELEGGHPFIKVWFEKREMVAGREDWDNQLAKAIRNCKCLFFIMSADSTAEHSNCKEEWAWALKYKKPVICLWIDNKAEDQFRLNSRQKIDFTSNFDAGLAKLRKAIAHLDSPAGQLDELNHRFADANRDFRRASDEDKPRIKAELDELTDQIKRQEEIVRNPKAAQEQTQKNIETGLERERKPEKPITSSAQSTKFINPPPGIAPNYFQDRLIETKQAVDFINDDAQRLMTIVGRGGVGKTAMVCRLLKELESGQLPDGLGAMKVEGIVYLSEIGSHRVTFVNIFYDLCKLLPAETANELDAIYKNPGGSTESKMCAVLEKFAGGRVVLLLDNFEPLVDSETFTIRDAELYEALRAFLNGTHTAVNIIITTRIAPKALNLIQPGRQRVLTLDEGLDSPYAENILREMDVDGRIGLQSASDALLGRARERTRGYPRALEALFAILASDRYTTLAELLAMPTPVNVVEALVGEAFNRLDTNAQKVMQALAVYNRPVTPAAVDYLLAPYIPAIDSAPILQRLANMHFARKESGRFYLHPVDREFAFGLIGNQELGIRKQDSDSPQSLIPNQLIPNQLFTQHDLTSRAADYFRKARKPRAEWKKLEDLSAQLAEFDLRCTAGDYDTAGDILSDIDYDCLQVWGYYRLLINYYEGVQGKLKSSRLKKRSLNELGLAYYAIGNVRKCIECYENALEIVKEEKDREYEGVLLGNLGLAYADLGDAHKAIEFYEQALVIAHEIGDRRGESAGLGNLGGAYADLGDAHKAIEFYEQALVIAHEISDRRGEGTNLSNIAGQYSSLGEYEKSIGFYNQALQNARDIGNKYGESKRLNGLAGVLIEKGDLKNAVNNSQESFRIGQEMSSPEVCIESGNTLATALLFSEKFKDALQVIQEASKFDRPNFIYNVSALHGIIALRQGERETAQEAFTKSIAQADEILAKTPDYYDALDAKGLALSGLMVIGKWGDSDDAGYTVAEAMEIFGRARKIAPHAGVVKRVLRLFDELAQCDPHGLLKDVRPAAAGVATSAKSG